MFSEDLSNKLLDGTPYHVSIKVLFLLFLINNTGQRNYGLKCRSVCVLLLCVCTYVTCVRCKRHYLPIDIVLFYHCSTIKDEDMRQYLKWYSR